MIESFKLDEGHKISISGKKEQVLYFIERNNDKNDKTQICHFILAKEVSEAGYFCNEFIINQIRKFFMVIKEQPFDIIEILKKSSKDININKNEINKMILED